MTLTFEQIERDAQLDNSRGLNCEALGLTVRQAACMFSGRDGWRYSNTANIHHVYTPIKPVWTVLTFQGQAFYLTPREAARIEQFLNEPATTTTINQRAEHGHELIIWKNEDGTGTVYVRGPRGKVIGNIDWASRETR